jgi:hypothetical protein
MSEQKDTLIDLLFNLDTHIVNEEVSNKVIDSLISDVTELKRRNDVLYSVLHKISNEIPLKSNILQYYIEINDTVKGDKSVVEKYVSEYKNILKDDICTLAKWEEFADDLKKLGVYDDMKDWIRIFSPKKN